MRLNSRELFRGLLASAVTGLIFIPYVGFSQEFPNRTIRIVVPLPPGGSNDLVARVFSEKLPAALGQPVIVENRAGGSGNPATEFVARSAPDGHTLILANTSHVVNAAFFKTLPYDPIKDFSAVTMAYNVAFALVINAGIPARNTKEFIAWARAQPKGVTYASAGIGAPHHLAMEMFQALTAAKMLHIPYKGAGQFVPAMLSGEVETVIGAINSLLPHIKSGKLRPLAMAGRPNALLPGLPSLKTEVPGFDLDNWTGILAPAATPAPIIQRLNAEFVKVLKTTESAERLEPQGIEIIASTAEFYTDALKAYLPRVIKLVRDAGIKIEQ
ncbi:MAG: Bug family tripartite tricarboxylate transporter substrate binding protein [Burkholderiales bacterium]